MRELREDTFSRNKSDDAHKHIEKVLDIVSLFNIPGLSQDPIMLSVFPITVIGAAKRYCPPSMTSKQLEDIHKFKQEGDETLYQAWESCSDLIYKCPLHDLNSQQKTWNDEFGNRRISSGSSDGIVAITSKLDSLGLCGRTLLDKECSLNEEVKGVKEVKYGDFGRSYLNNGGNIAMYRVGPPGYYTSMDNFPPFSE
ncbi:hypothetical protein Tco_1146528 [Tanacetum coccineum]